MSRESPEGPPEPGSNPRLARDEPIEHEAAALPLVQLQNPIDGVLRNDGVGVDEAEHTPASWPRPRRCAPRRTCRRRTGPVARQRRSANVLDDRPPSRLRSRRRRRRPRRECPGARDRAATRRRRAQRSRESPRASRRSAPLRFAPGSRTERRRSDITPAGRQLVSAHLERRLVRDTMPRPPASDEEARAARARDRTRSPAALTSRRSSGAV